jgi:DNA-binding NarL/FixJ family response regulator
VQVQVPAEGSTLHRMVTSALEHEGVDALVLARRGGESRFRAPPRAVDVVVVPEPERAADLRELAKALPGARIIVVSPQVTGASAQRLLEVGASGIVAESEATETLGPAVRAVMAGLVCVPRVAREVVVPPALSTRERQVLALMAGGLSNAEIAERLYLSESTVKSHAASAFRRLGVRSRREAVALVLGSSETLRRSVLMSHPLEPPPSGDERRRGGGG